jgi:hypothetical protein
MTKPEREKVEAEFKGLYPNWPVELKLTAKKKAEMIATWHQDMARSAEILAY